MGGKLLKRRVAESVASFLAIGLTKVQSQQSKKTKDCTRSLPHHLPSPMESTRSNQLWGKFITPKMKA